MRHAAEAVSHADLGWFFQKYVAGTDEIPWDDFFKSVGLASGAAEPVRLPISDSSPRRNFDAALVVCCGHARKRGRAGRLSVGRFILEINGQSAGDRFRRHFADLRPGETLRLRVRNSEGERELQWKLGSRQELEFELVDLDKITPEQKARRAAWLKGEAQTAGEARP